MKYGNIELNKPLILAPMEDITDLSFRQICVELGADFVFTEFVNCEGLIRNDEKTHKKLILSEKERPAGIQIYGENIDSMVKAAEMADEEKPEILDINAGCWVRKVAGRGAGAGLMKDPEYLQNMVKKIVKAVKSPVTVKTRLGWDAENKNIIEIAKRVEDAGAVAITVHCRTKSQGHSGDPDWSWIEKVKEAVKIPVILNGGLITAEDVMRAYKDIPADGFMIARGAIFHPWIFTEAKQLITDGEIDIKIDPEKRINTALRHLSYSIKIKDEKRAVTEFRKFYSGYLKGLYNSSKIRNEMMKFSTYNEVENMLMHYLEQLNSMEV